ncbi:MAG TPA: type VI secretion system protein TssA [Pyrinomonadaceae bacterium]|jgi:type VI secretion system protein ImpA
MQALLTPVSDDAPAGSYLRYTLYPEIEAARRSDDRLPRGQWSLKEVKTADWAKVMRLTRDALATRSKDLQLGAWLAEALVKVRGFDGLREGLVIVRGLQEHFWDEMHPRIEDGELEGRVRIIEWLSRQLALAVKEVPLTRRLAGDNYNYFQWEESLRPAPVVEDDEDDEADEAKAAAREAARLWVDAEKWRQAKDGTPREFYEQSLATLAECSAELTALDGELDEKFTETHGDKSVNNNPGLKKLEKSLQEVSELVERILGEKPMNARKPAKNKGQPPPPAAGHDDPGRARTSPPRPDQTVPPDAPRAEENGGGMRGDGVIRSRADALERLREVAAFFHETEPQSPVSYLVERAVKWGSMPLEEWLADVIGEEPALKKLRETLGLPPSESAEDESDNPDEEE